MMLYVLGIDPSSNYVGLAVLGVDSETFELKSIETIHFNLSIAKNLSDNYSSLLVRMIRLRDQTRGIIDTYNIKAIAYERAHASASKPGAFEPLVSCTTTMCLEFIDKIPMVRIDVFSPGEVKNAMGAKGNCSKEDMLTACHTNETLLEFVKPDLITEHEIDAIAVGLCWVKYYKTKKELLF